MMAAVPQAVQAKSFLVPGGAASLHDQKIPEQCRGAITLVGDVGFEGVQTTAHNFNSAAGGGESLRFDKTPSADGPTDVKPGVYYVDVWWAGGPAGRAAPSARRSSSSCISRHHSGARGPARAARCGPRSPPQHSVLSTQH